MSPAAISSHPDPRPCLSPQSPLLLLTPPPLVLRSNNLHLTFTSSIALSSSSSDWRSLVLLRTSGLTLNLTLTTNTTLLTSASPLLESWARIFTDAPLWKQLLFTSSLAINGSAIFIILSRSTPCSVESLFPELLPCGRIPRITMDFVFSGLERMDLRAMLGLTDTALRSFVGDKVAGYAPMIGRPGYFKAMEDRREFVDVVAEVLGRNGGGGETLADVWRCVLGNVKCSERVKGLDLKNVEDQKWGGEPGERGDARVEDVDMLFEDEEDELLMDDSDGLLMFEDEEDELLMDDSDGLLMFEDEEDELLMDDSDGLLMFEDEEDELLMDDSDELLMFDDENSVEDLWQGLEDHNTKTEGEDDWEGFMAGMF